MMKFYGYFRSSSAHRCRIGFNLKGVTPDFEPVHLRRGGGEQKMPAYRAINPQGLVPALVLDDAVLFQSLAILEWLDETHREPAFLPADPIARARVRGFAGIIACDIHPLQNLRVLDYLKTELGHDQKVADDWCRRWIGEGLLGCEAMLAAEGRRGDFCFGATPGLADICLVPQIHSARRFGVDLSAMPRLVEIFEACEALPAFAAARPAAQPDAEA
jgi:maleylacetoacetate isomerase